MHKDLGRVGVLLGGKSAEREISLMSGNGVLAALREAGVDAHPFDPAERSIAELAAEKFDRVFIVLHGRYGEDGSMQGVLEQLGIPYTGSGVMASAIAMDKDMTKQIWRAAGLRTPDSVMLDADSDWPAVAARLGLPLIVKPAHEGSTLGLTKVTEAGQLEQAFKTAAGFDRAVMAEQFIDGMELTCAVLGRDAGAYALPVIRIVAPDANYDYQNKYFTDDTEYRCPSGIDAALEATVRDISVASFRALHCRGWARADIMVRASDNVPFLLEINTSPGMTGHSLVPMAAKVTGMDYQQLCVHILQTATLDSARKQPVPEQQ